MNRHTKGGYHESSAARAFYAMRRATEEGRHCDALAYAVEAGTLAEVGYGASLPDCALHEVRETHQDRSHGAETPARYRLSCGHVTDVWAPPSASAGRAWCDTCTGIAEMLHVLPKGVDA